MVYKWCSCKRLSSNQGLEWFISGVVVRDSVQTKVWSWEWFISAVVVRDSVQTKVWSGL